MPRMKYHKRSLASKLRRQKQRLLLGKGQRGFVKLGLPLEKEQSCVTESVDTEFDVFQIPIEDENLEETQEDTQLTVQSLLVHLEQTSEEIPSGAQENHIVKDLEETQEDTQLTVQSLLVHLEPTSEESPSGAQERLKTPEEPQEDTQLTVVPELMFFPEDLDLFHETTT